MLLGERRFLHKTAITGKGNEGATKFLPKGVVQIPNRHKPPQPAIMLHSASQNLSLN